MELPAQPIPSQRSVCVNAPLGYVDMSIKQWTIRAVPIFDIFVRSSYYSRRLPRWLID